MAMTEISEAAKREACKLANEIRRERGLLGRDLWDMGRLPFDTCPPAELEALACVLQEHSDTAAEACRLIGFVTDAADKSARDTLQSIILPDDPDPLEEALKGNTGFANPKRAAEAVRSRLAAAGYEIRKR